MIRAIALARLYRGVLGLLAAVARAAAASPAWDATPAATRATALERLADDVLDLGIAGRVGFADEQRQF